MRLYSEVIYSKANVLGKHPILRFCKVQDKSLFGNKRFRTMQFDRYCVLMHISKQFCAHTLYEWLDIVDPINKLFQSEMGRRVSGGEVLNGTDAAMGECCRLIILFKKGKVYSRLSKYNIESEQ